MKNLNPRMGARKGAMLALAALTMAVPAVAQYTYPSCTDLQPTDFQRTELFSRNGSTGSTAVPDLSEPVAMASGRIFISCSARARSASMTSPRKR
jgi:hypothetical protein